MAFDQRDYLLKNHIEATNKNLEIFNPDESKYRTRTDFEGHQFAAKYLIKNSKKIYWEILIVFALCWIIYAIIKIIPLI